MWTSSSASPASRRRANCSGSSHAWISRPASAGPSNGTGRRGLIRLVAPEMSPEEIEAASRVLRSGRLVQAAEVQQFEDELAAYLGVDHVVAVSSGTAALHLALLALGVGPGVEVIVPDFTFPAT